MIQQYLGYATWLLQKLKRLLLGEQEVTADELEEAFSAEVRSHVVLFVDRMCGTFGVLKDKKPCMSLLLAAC